MVLVETQIRDSDGTSSESENEIDENDNVLNKGPDSDSDDNMSGSDNGTHEAESSGSSCSKDLNKPDDTRTNRAKIRDLLIFKEINNQKLPTMLPPTCAMTFPDPDELHKFTLQVIPRSGDWNGGKFLFDVVVPEEYNFEPPKVKCTTKIWHPNISEDGAVCLSILRSGAIDETGWNPARSLKDVVFGINSLFNDLVNFHDALNNQAAEMFAKDPARFRAKVKEYIRDYARP